MTERIHVFPTPEKPYIVQRDPSLLAETGSRIVYRDLVHWRHTTEFPAPFCAYCNDGRCEQRVEWSPAWSQEVVVHDRPRWAQ